MAGMQGGLLKLVESTQDCKVNTDIAIMKLTETTMKIHERVSQEPSARSKGENKQMDNAKEMNQVKDSVCQLQNVLTKKLTAPSTNSTFEHEGM